MKKYIIISLFLSFIMSQCNYLDIVPDNTVEITHLFESKEKAYRALSTCYNYMPNYEQIHSTMSLAGDEFLGRLDAAVADNVNLSRGEKIMRGFQNSNSPLLSYWDGSGGVKSLYQGIRICNIFLSNIQNVPDLNIEEQKDWTAQIKVLKAFYHFYLLRLYGPIVLVDKNFEPSSSVEEIQQERKPIEECFQFVLNLINEALYNENGQEKTDLPNKRESASLGQIDRIIAKALKAQVLLYRASPLFNGNSEYYSNFKGINGQLLFPMEYNPEKWKEALDAIDIAINAAHDAGKELYEYKSKTVKYWDEENWKKSEIIQYCFNNRYSIVDPWNNELIWGYSGISYSGEGGLAHVAQCRSI